MPNKVLLSPLIARLSGTMSHPNSALVIRYTGVGKGSLITPKSRGGPETKTRIWYQTQWIWNYLDDFWGRLSHSDHILWAKHAHNSSKTPRSGFAYFRSVNIMRLLFWYPPIPRPPNTCDSVQHLASYSPDNPGLFLDSFKNVWRIGHTYPKSDPIEFSEELPYDPWLPTPPEYRHHITPPPSPPFSPCYPKGSYIITALPTDNGYIHPRGVETYSIGSKATYWAIPDCGYQATSFFDGVHPITPPTYHTFQHIHLNHTLDARFSLIPYDLCGDDFNRPNALHLGECWTPEVEPHLPCIIDNYKATFYYNHMIGGFQTTTQFFHKHLSSSSVAMGADWNALSDMAATGRYQSFLTFLACRKSITEAGNSCSMILVADSLDGASHLSFWTLQDGHATRHLLHPLWNNPHGRWEFYAREVTKNSLLMQAFWNNLIVARIEVNLYRRGSWTGFQLRMRPISGLVTHGTATIDDYTTEAVPWTGI
ncbi:hypothetical protein ES705_29099 [subsurface metagenome]